MLAGGVAPHTRDGVVLMGVLATGRGPPASRPASTPASRVDPVLARAAIGVSGPAGLTWTKSSIGGASWGSVVAVGAGNAVVATAWATQLRLVQTQLLAKIANAVGDGVVTVLKISGPTAPSWRKGPRHISGRGPRDTYG
jgi:hypothetical protein